MNPNHSQLLARAVCFGPTLPPVMVRQSFRATRDGVTVTYSVCIGGAGIDYSSVTSILYTYSAFSITLRFFTPVGWGYTGPTLGLGLPRYQLRVSDITVTDSARFCGGGFDYVVLITLALPVFEYFLHFILRACVICAFWLR